jgi:hypothetical protein
MVQLPQNVHAEAMPTAVGYKVPPRTHAAMYVCSMAQHGWHLEPHLLVLKALGIKRSHVCSTLQAQVKKRNLMG